MRAHQQAAFILLNRPYSESSWIVEVFSREYGRLALMAKGARRPKSRLKGVLLPFQPLLTSWTGKGEIPILTSAEIDLKNFDLVDNELHEHALVCGFYCNELLVNLVHRHDPHQTLFDEYMRTIIALSQCKKNDELAEVLREFEKIIIKETGYGVSFTSVAGSDEKINPDAFYRFHAGKGFIVAKANEKNAVSGRIVLALSHNIDAKSAEDNIYRNDLSDTEKAQSKHLMRNILHLNLGYKPIISRQLFLPCGFT